MSAYPQEEDHEWQDRRGRAWTLQRSALCAVCGSTPDAHPYCLACDAVDAELALLRRRLHELHQRPE